MSDQNEDPENFADDILKGAGEIGKFINENERRTRYIIEKKQIPAFKIGNQIRARKSELKKRYRAQTD